MDQPLIIKFNNVDDYEYFISKRADQWWLSSIWYNGKIIGDLQISINNKDKFMVLLKNNDKLFCRQNCVIVYTDLKYILHEMC